MISFSGSPSPLAVSTIRKKIKGKEKNQEKKRERERQREDCSSRNDNVYL
jgi:hypothetical protein